MGQASPSHKGNSGQQSQLRTAQSLLLLSSTCSSQPVFVLALLIFSSLCVGEELLAVFQQRLRWTFVIRLLSSR